MSNTKHTPGPWKVGASIWGVNDSNTSLAVWPDPHGRNPICLISPIQEVKEHDQANAKLIAAAPDTLEALTGKEEDPHLWAVNWLATLLRVCRKQEVYKAIVEDQGNDVDAVQTMFTELDTLVISGNAAIKKATE